MLLSNLAEPQWISISCKKHLLASILCQTSKSDNLQKNNKESKNLEKKILCHPNSLLLGEKCYLFLWFNNMNREKLTLQNACHLQGKEVIHSVSKILHILIKSISAPFYPVLSQHNITMLKRHTHERYVGVDKIVHDYVPILKANGFIVCQTNSSGINQFKGNIFLCRNGHSISVIFVCDGFVDCVNDFTDETSCSRKHSVKTKLKVYSPEVQSKFSYLTALFYKSVTGECYKYTSSEWHEFTLRHDREVSKYFLCNNHQQIDKILVDDLVPDCGPEAEDEPKMKDLIKHNRLESCLHPHLIPCREGHSKYFHISDVCKYKLNSRHHIFPCRNGGHLESCKEFECNAMFRCMNSYCIPWNYVCDNKWDCPDGHDDISGLCSKSSFCAEMFRCRFTNFICIHLGNLCDEEYNCPR